MFESGFKESVENKMKIVDFSFETVKLALEILYDRKIPTLTMEENMDLFQFFDKYAIMDLRVIFFVRNFNSTKMLNF